MQEFRTEFMVKKHFIVETVLVHENKCCTQVWICWFSWLHSPPIYSKGIVFCENSWQSGDDSGQV